MSVVKIKTIFIALFLVPIWKNLGWKYKNVQQIFKKINIDNFVTLKHIVFGYKIFDIDYFDCNYFLLTILGLSICKVYYVSEQQTKQVSIYSSFVREYITRISQVQKLQDSKLLTKIKIYIYRKIICL